MTTREEAQRALNTLDMEYDDGPVCRQCKLHFSLSSYDVERPMCSAKCELAFIEDYMGVEQ